MRYTGPKVKKARRFGMAFTAKDTKALQKRNYAPGQHGQNRSRLSEYGLQLREKQKAKINYGLLERQFEGYFNKALKQHGVTGDNLLKLLELRLDNIVFRMGFADTRPQARQLVGHGFIEVNGKKVDIPSYQVRAGEAISIKEVSRKNPHIEGAWQTASGRGRPSWISQDGGDMAARISGLPTREDIDRSINEQLIVELYGK